MDKINQVRADQLGMPVGTATAILRKKILFFLIQQMELNICFQCGEKIEVVDDLSIEHKVPWLHSENPKELFFSLDNIAFSHLSCNSSAHRKRITNAVELICVTCGKEFIREEYQIRPKLFIGQKDFYCSHSCSAKSIGKGYGRRNFE